jgi:hypothetical protein
MDKDKIIEMAVQAGTLRVIAELNVEILEAFVKLVAKAKAEEIALACEKLPFGDTAQSFAVWIREQ